ncbi:MAG: zinc ribbon domain-containing protein [Acidobacteriia bacterium]|nr:zinc ribbon domain-containing protein [Terriglobia bacterium]
MFCNQCGTPVQPDYNLCPKCGQRLLHPVVAVSDPSRLDRHLRILGTLWMIAGALFLIPSIILLLIGSAAHFAIQGNELVRHMAPLFLNLLGGSLLVVAAGGICVGWGLMERLPWARVTAVVLGVITLFHPPFGTALGIYTLWVLLSNDAGPQYDRMARAA